MVILMLVILIGDSGLIWVIPMTNDVDYIFMGLYIFSGVVSKNFATFLALLLLMFEGSLYNTI